MKNKLVISLMAASVITGSLFADKLESMEGLTTSRIICESGVEGFVLSIVREDAEDAVLYESCSSDGIDVETKELVETRLEQLDYVTPRLPGDFVTFWETEYYFPNGYTEPSSQGNNTCNGGYNSSSEPSNISFDCHQNNTNPGALSSAWLNAVNITSHLQFWGTDVNDITALSNLTAVQTLNFSYNNTLANVNGLQNLQSVSWNLHLNNMGNLSDISALSSLSNVGRVYISQSTKIKDISVFDNLNTVSGWVMFDNREYTTKMSADSLLCRTFPDKVRTGSWDNVITVSSSDKSKYCYE